MHTADTAAPRRYILTISCPDTVGIVAAVSTFLAERSLFIVDSSHFGDPSTRRFYMRTTFEHPALPASAALGAEFAPVGERFGMDWKIHDTALKPRTLIMVSRSDHCLNDLLYRYRNGALAIDIPAVVGNHRDLQRMTEWHGIPFHHLQVDDGNRAVQEARILEMVERLQVDLVVLARYMQILTPTLTAPLAGRCINIHHSFLPSFKGARPYHQAHNRGVKLIGATAHYVTDDLDEGPIIEQEVQRVDHTHTPEELASIGRDIESLVLSRAVRYHVERRVLLDGIKTVVFR